MLAALAAPAGAAAKASHLTPLDAFVREGNSGTAKMRFELVLSKAGSKPVRVDYSTSPGGLHPAGPTDYADVQGTLVIKPHSTTGTITVPVDGDRIDEYAETVKLALTNPRGAVLGRPGATGFILDDDAPPTVSIGDTSIPEGNAGATNASFPVTLLRASGKTISVQASTTDFTAVSPTDFTAVAPTTLTFAPGETVKQLAVPVQGDVTYENDEAFAATLSNPSSDVSLGRQGAVATITNDDSPPSISIDDVSVSEGNSGTTNATFTVSLSPASGLPASVQYTTQDGTATAPGDYSAASGTLNFSAGETSKPVTVHVQGDFAKEPDETFTVQLSNAAGSTITDTTGVGTIQDDGDDSLNETDSPAEADACSVAPASFNVTTAQSTQAITGDITEAGVTPPAGQGPGIAAQVGYGAQGSDPRAGGWTWTNATYDSDQMSADRYTATFIAPAAGTYSYAYRFTMDAGASYTYCDTDGAGSNPGLTFNPTADGVMTVTP